MTGAELRDAGLEQAGSGAPVAVLVSWETEARFALLKLALADANFTVEDLRPMLPPPPNPNCFGAVFNKAHRDGLIVPAGTTIANRPQRHASLLRMWRRA